MRGRAVLRTAPWIPLLGSAGVASALLLVAAAVHRSVFVMFAALLGTATCGCTAAFVLDERAADVADATPTSRGQRLAWRMPVLALPAVVAVGGLALLDRVDPASRWLHLLPLAAGSLAVGVGVAAIMRRAGSDAPGELAGALVFLTIVLGVAIEPFRRWLPLAPLGPTPHVGRSVAFWTLAGVACALVAGASLRDPGAPPIRLHRETP